MILMPTTSTSNVWTIVEPAARPEPPQWMSFSTLLEIESCPSLWSLRSAHYPNIWNGRGYPRPLDLASIEGKIVHSAIERAAKELVKGGCTSTSETNAIAILKQLGGFSALVKDCTAKLLQRHNDNPRAQAALENIRRKLDGRIPELRSRVQRQLSRVRLDGRQPMQTAPRMERQHDQRFPLGSGSHPEVELRSSEMGWHGFVDLLTLSDLECEIRDFKTGAVKQQHELQLRLYALLWARDRELNPAGRLANRLVLSYDDREVQVTAPTAESLKILEAEIMVRTRSARGHVLSPKPEARPSAENCAHCLVRQLCGDYWNWLETHRSETGVDVAQFADLEIEIRRRRGPTSWDGIALRGPFSTSGRSVVLRSASLSLDIKPGDRVRAQNVSLIESGDSENEVGPLVATAGVYSEVFFAQ